MNPRSHMIRFAAACLLLALRPALAAEPGVAPESAKTPDAATSALVAQAAPAVQGSAGAPIGAASDAAVPAARTAVDWSYTPRRTFQARRR
jgi:hypothetical protein